LRICSFKSREVRANPRVLLRLNAIPVVLRDWMPYCKGSSWRGLQNHHLKGVKNA
jgi:hypothetical protein